QGPFAGASGVAEDRHGHVPVGVPQCRGGALGRFQHQRPGGEGIPSVVTRSPSRCTSAPRPIATGNQAEVSGAAMPVRSPAVSPTIQGIREPRTTFIARTANAHSTVTMTTGPTWT